MNDNNVAATLLFHSLGRATLEEANIRHCYRTIRTPLRTQVAVIEHIHAARQKFLNFAQHDFFVLRMGAPD